MASLEARKDLNKTLYAKTLIEDTAQAALRLVTRVSPNQSNAAPLIGARAKNSQAASARAPVARRGAPAAAAQRTFRFQRPQARRREVRPA